MPKERNIGDRVQFSSNGLSLAAGIYWGTIKGFREYDFAKIAIVMLDNGVQVYPCIAERKKKTDEWTPV